jgi:purine-binding chemotaxis protein CheW
MIPGNAATLSDAEAPTLGGARSDYVTAVADGQRFGIPIEDVHDVFHLGPVTPVPLAPPAILGVLNLRGRVVTAIDLRRRLGLASTASRAGGMAIGLEHERQSYCLVVDAVTEIVRLPDDELEPNPIHLDPRWAGMSRGVLRLEDTLLLVIDTAAVLAFDPPSPTLLRT